MISQDSNNYVVPIAAAVVVWIWILGLVIFLS